MNSRQGFVLFLAGMLITSFTAIKVSLAQPKPSIAVQKEESTVLSSMKLDHVAIRVPNFEETVRWYKEKLGFKEVVQWKAPPYVDPNLQFAYLELNGAVIEIAGGGNPTRAVPPPATIKETFRLQGYIHVCLRVDDIDAVVAELKQRGVEVFAGPNVNPTLNRKFFHFQDNNGFDVELVQYL